MKTTLTLDEDVAAAVRRVQRKRGWSRKTVINEALRRGLREIEGPRRPADVYRTPSVDLGQCLVASLDDASQALALAEGEAWK